MFLVGTSSIPVKNPEIATEAASKIVVLPTPLSPNIMLNPGSNSNLILSNIL